MREASGQRGQRGQRFPQISLRSGQRGQRGQRFSAPFQSPEGKIINLAREHRATFSAERIEGG